MSKVRADMIFTQAIAVVVFELDSGCQGDKIDNNSHQVFRQVPWKFHHVTEINAAQNSSRKMHVRQEYYELHKDLPLFSIRSMHFGKPTVRVHLFTHSQEQMVNFYKTLLRIEPTKVREDFCYFFLTELTGAQIQLSLKNSENIMVYPLASALLTFRLPSLPDGIEAEKVDCEHYRLNDPDHNPVLVHLSRSQATEQSRDSSCDLVKETQPVKECVLVSTTDGGGKELSDKVKRQTEGGESNSRHWPDVIPDEENFPKPKSLTPTYVKLRRNLHSGSPKLVRKLNITTSSVHKPAVTMGEKDDGLQKRMMVTSRETVNIQETF